MNKYYLERKDGKTLLWREENDKRFVIVLPQEFVTNWLGYSALRGKARVVECLSVVDYFRIKSLLQSYFLSSCDNQN